MRDPVRIRIRLVRPKKSISYHGFVRHETSVLDLKGWLLWLIKKEVCVPNATLWCDRQNPTMEVVMLEGKPRTLEFNWKNGSLGRQDEMAFVRDVETKCPSAYTGV